MSYRATPPPPFLLKLVLHIFNFPEEAGHSNKLVPLHSWLPNLSIAFIAASAFLNPWKYWLRSPAHSCLQESSITSEAENKANLLPLNLYGEARGKEGSQKKDVRIIHYATKK